MKFNLTLLALAAILAIGEHNARQKPSAPAPAIQPGTKPALPANRPGHTGPARRWAASQAMAIGGNA